MRRRIALAISVVTVSLVATVVACSNDDTPQPLNVAPDSGGDQPFDATLPSRDAGADTGVDSGTDARADASDAAHDANADVEVDAGFSLNGCGVSDFAAADYSAADASRIIYFSDSGAVYYADGGLIQYSPKCMTIKAGESVAWVGDFTNHYLSPQDNAPNNPIYNGVMGGDSGMGDDGSFSVTFDEAGAFGYGCQQHAAMRGAINVTP